MRKLLRSIGGCQMNGNDGTIINDVGVTLILNCTLYKRITHIKNMVYVLRKNKIYIKIEKSQESFIHYVHYSEILCQDMTIFFLLPFLKMLIN